MIDDHDDDADEGCWSSSWICIVLVLGILFYFIFAYTKFEALFLTAKSTQDIKTKETHSH